MSINIETNGVEEQQHPFYIIRYIVKDGQAEVLRSVARYIHTKERVQFLEPDLKKIQTLPNSITHINKIEQIIRNEGQRLAAKHQA